MRRTSLALAGTLTLLAAGSALAQSSNGAAGSTTVNSPPRQGEMTTGGMGARSGSGVPMGNAGSGGNASVPGTTPGVTIGGSPTSGPPGTGGTAGGPGGVNR